MSRRLIGADGSLEGGLRPMAGYKLVRQLALGASELLNGSDFWVLTLSVTATETKRGYLYRTVTPGGLYSIYFEHWTGTAWQRDAILLNQSGAWGANMGVTVRNRWCYVAVRGQETIGFYYENQSTIRRYSNNSSTLNQGRTGPGLVPTMVKNDPTLLPILGSPNVEASLDNDTGDYDGLNVATVHVVPEDTDLTGLPNDAEREALPPQSYGFAFRLRDRANGRYTSLSKVQVFDDTAFPVDADAAPVAAYTLFEVLSSNEYDTIEIYRTVGDITESEVSGIQANLFLEADILRDTNKAADQTGVKSGFTRVLWWGATNRISIMYQQQYANKALFDERMPKAGLILFYDGILLSTDIDEGSDGSVNDTAGQVRWSSTIEPSVELFPPLNRWLSPNAQDTWVSMAVFGSNMIAFSLDRVYLARLESGYLRVESVHQGFGCPARRGVAFQGELAYYPNEKGLYVIDGRGKLDRIDALNSLFVDQWQGDVSSVVLAYDPLDNTVTGVHTTRGEAFILWLNTSTITEMNDLTFKAGHTGPIPGVLDATRRAQWVTQNGFVFVYDSQRENGNLTLLGQGGVFEGVEIDWSGIFATFTLPGVFDDRLKGARIYVVESDDLSDTEGSHIGHYLTVASITPGAETTAFTCAKSVGSHAGTLVSAGLLTDYLETGGTFSLSLAPIYFQWQGWALYGTEGPQFDLFRVRRISTSKAYFVDVGTESETDWARSLVFEANQTEPSVRALPTNNSGALVANVRNNEPRHSTLTEYEGTLLYPGVEIVSAGLDFLLLGVVCEGRLLSTDFRGTFRS